ncbi:RagB/SusD family nutrient uptake outer membrane protein [Prevotella sp. KH2C16]|uniref:RagB/SusD family nutrient uptake outer membrane protein n=1 Tax=Prevotella sp. KH2C16 TaxID=1855325 RepID=UPI0008E7AE8D|nr:RagB/SusD family nutrient uptake outer membrane protein [Prevotella sp. KH2C16]SFF82480.1 Starch-binding associating with outer membrane [Prevotella sp. KH2C16]
MKRNILYAICLIGTFIGMTSCHDLNLNPLSNGSTENWYSTAKEIEMAVNAMYSSTYWRPEGDNQTDWSDDAVYRESLTEFENATITSENWIVSLYWRTNFQMVSYSNSVINKYRRAINNGANEAEVMAFVGEAKFFRGVAYGRLLTRFGDVPYLTSEINIDEGLNMARTPKDEVLRHVYADLDSAALLLPVSYSGNQRATKGAALAMKARIALYLGDYATAAQASKAVMDLGVYDLEPSYRKLFLQSTKSSKEFIFILPRSISMNIDVLNSTTVKNKMVRNAGGWSAVDPSWDLLAAYTCTDGLPIDESPLFDSHNPFKNRDPRCSETLVPFGESFLGYVYSPSPADTEVLNTKTGKMGYNNDTRINKQYASFNGLVWKKGIDESWMDNGYTAENPLIVMRYADVLLMYAEAKIELNQIDQTVVDAMNTVRARAYGVDKAAITSYPAFSILPQKDMRKQLRMERRMELAGENLRFADLMRWHLSEVVMKKKQYGMLYPATDCLTKVVNTGNWFWPVTPDIDDNGCPDFTKMEATGLIQVLSQRQWDDRQYLWPIPAKEKQINDKITQNPGY